MYSSHKLDKSSSNWEAMLKSILDDLEENTGNCPHTDDWNLHLATEKEIVQLVSIIVHGLSNQFQY